MHGLQEQLKCAQRYMQLVGFWQLTSKHANDDTDAWYPSTVSQTTRGIDFFAIMAHHQTACDVSGIWCRHGSDCSIERIKTDVLCQLSV